MGLQNILTIAWILNAFEAYIFIDLMTIFLDEMNAISDLKEKRFAKDFNIWGQRFYWKSAMQKDAKKRLAGSGSGSL